MPMTLLTQRSSSVILSIKRVLNIQSKFYLGKTMKLLNDKKEFRKALELFDQSKKNQETEIFSSFVITQALKASTHLGDLKRGIDIHRLISSRATNDIFILPSLIHLYMQCGEVSKAQSLFNMTTEKPPAVFGAMMKGYIKNDQSNLAINLFNQIPNPDEVNVILLFNACTQLGTVQALNDVKRVSKTISRSFYSNIRLLTSLLDALITCGDVKEARLLFEKSPKKIFPMYGVMMKGYIKNNQSNLAIELFKTISNPDEILLNLLFKSSGQLRTIEALNLTKKVWKEMPARFQLNPYLLTSLLNTLIECNDLTEAQLWFERSTNKVSPMFGAMMKGYIKHNQANLAIKLFKEIDNPDEILLTFLFNACAQLGTDYALILTKQVWKELPKSFHSNIPLSTSLFDALIKCGDCSNAEILFSKMKRTVISYGNLMNGMNYQNQYWKTVKLFNQMKNDQIEGDLIIYLSLLKALSNIADYSISQSIVEQIPNSFLLDNRLQTALINMWGRVGSIIDAKDIFDNLTNRDHTVYTAMIHTYGLNGRASQAIQIYHQMPQELINEATSTCVLNACSHSGFVEEARSIFGRIFVKTERIFGAMIDCLSRGAFFEEAEQLIDEYERNHSPELIMHMSLLSGARNENNYHLAERVYHRMKKLFPHQISSLTSAAILLANVYASSGQTEKASNIRIQLEQLGLKKKVGLSWTVVNGQYFEFRAHDQSHPRSKEIYDELEKISKELIEHGHQYDSSWITRPLNENETVASVLGGHSERLAIACNFVFNPKTKRIQLSKNLRVCGDCHQSTKLIAFIRQCEIVVRDPNRIHHFDTNGQCSCHDYF